jgi:tetratricopeptide (TPR) repeat protein
MRLNTVVLALCVSGCEAMSAVRAGDAVNKAAEHYDAGRYREALEAYDTAINSSPAYGYAHLGRGNTLRQLGRVEEAIGAYRTAVQLLPDNPLIERALGMALVEGGKPAEAITVLQRATAHDDSPLIALELSIALARAGRRDEARRLYSGYRSQCGNCASTAETERLEAALAAAGVK